MSQRRSEPHPRPLPHICPKEWLVHDDAAAHIYRRLYRQLLVLKWNISTFPYCEIARWHTRA